MPVHSSGGFGGSNAFVLTVVIEECGLDENFYLDGIGLLHALLEPGNDGLDLFEAKAGVEF